ncbi:acyltransferase family protein [Pseudomonas sp. P8_241]|uniref:acyltransferase family protein n=1 Tax=Pseudomonas sp. P8_241 TaxID=3043445 RepID=UPI002A367628|nr:acyltransferase family protein [Pseudomonas sp. P8_241]WPN49714.1 acyltransferase family protein [Pseudomonas sp. P8_241]
MTSSAEQAIRLAPHDTTHPKYRPDIDGLRAIAVLLVVLYHAKFPVLGGFVGVDVFFVISGYLITFILRREILTDRFSFQSFYVRRIKRLLPAYAFMLLCLSAYCYQYLMPDDLLSYAKSALYSMVAASNIYFFSGTGYFGSASTEPLLHTWSIAVEEQFYIVWPVILLGLAWAGSKKTARCVIAAIFVGSLVASEIYAVDHKNAAYLLLPFRFFELMIGCTLALYQHRVARLISAPGALSIVGLILIIGSALLMNESFSFPGLNALPVCLGTAFVIAAGFKSQTGIGTKVLGLAPIRYVGKVSYSFYLWHWPVLVLAQYRGIELTHFNAAILMVFAFAASAISYHLVETPFRSMRAKGFKTIVATMYLVPLVAIGSMTYVIIENDGFRARAGELVAELEETNTSHVQRAQCISTLQVGNTDECHLGVTKMAMDGMLIGDSFANAYAPFVDVLAKDAGLMIHDTTAGSTPAIPGVFVMDMQNKISNEESLKIATYNTLRFEMAKKQKIVILSNFWNSYADWQVRFRVHNSNISDINDDVEELQFNTVKAFLDSGVKVVILAQPFAEIGRATVSKMREMKLHHTALSTVLIPPVQKKTDRIEYKIKERFPEVILIDPNDVLCEQTCSPVVNGKIIFRLDGSHLNAPGAAALGNEFISKKGNPLKSL